MKPVMITPDGPRCQPPSPRARRRPLVYNVIMRRLLTILTFAVAIGGTTGRTCSGAAVPANGDSTGRHLLRPADLPKPFATSSAMNPPRVVPKPDGARLRLPAGFEGFEAAGRFDTPRQMRLSPNGDVFLAESGGGRITVLKDMDGDGRFERRHAYARRLDSPFGMAFVPPFLYVAGSGSVLRFRYQPGDTVARGEPEFVTALPDGGHWTRDLLYDERANRIYVSIGSRSNCAEEPADRAVVLWFTPPGAERPPNGVTLEPFASGLRNPVGLALEPVTRTVWTCVNERDGLGDELVPDYATGLVRGAFYGWPYSYIGANPQPGELGKKRPDLVARAVVPDVLFEAHSAALGLDFYTGTAFPGRYRGGAFAAHHGSWNRRHRVGYKVVFLPFEQGRATGGYEDFMTGFSADPGAEQVWGRPVGILMDRDSSLLVSDDGADVVWRVRYVGAPAR